MSRFVLGVKLLIAAGVMTVSVLAATISPVFRFSQRNVDE